MDTYLDGAFRRLSLYTSDSLNYFILGDFPTSVSIFRLNRLSANGAFGEALRRLRCEDGEMPDFGAAFDCLNGEPSLLQRFFQLFRSVDDHARDLGCQL